ncbi:glycosyltransferase family 2 protein [Glaciecola sp. HTCC2999]|uniref:glycosyltransferase family 2 protein n=1 Tax=Glaciecola sp. HTCC2999 TaxID=455436 RepID=UPI0000E0F5E8|nr:glycosyltransferase family 2 protein [Glaciecola sp. HTCC2999]
MEIKVSIVTATYNSIKYIGETYASILNQSYSNWEWLVTDDCSLDGTYEWLLEKSKEDSRIVIFRNKENLGAGASRNVSIGNSTGRYIAFLDSDDLWLPSKLEKQIKFMLNNNIDFCFTYYQKFSGELDGAEVYSPLKVSYDELLKRNSIGCLTVVYDTNEIGKVYMPTIRKRQDFALWLKILKKVDFAVCIPEVLAKYRVDSGMTQNKFKLLSYQWSLYRDVLKLPKLKSISLLIHHISQGYIKYIK